jgi:hypothetical protein
MIVLWILLAIIVAALVALYQYGYLFKNDPKKRRPWFAFLRFLTVFTILLLFIVPQFQSFKYETLLPQLVILVDDSKSLSHLGADEFVKSDVDFLKSNAELAKKYQISFFKFSEGLMSLDSLNFDGKFTDLQNSLSSVEDLYRDENKAIVILTDGIQNKGTNLRYFNKNENTSIYPIIYGDTTRYPDLKINQLNSNRYSYLNNEFPVEAVIEYQGDEAITSMFKVTEGEQTLYSEKISLSPNNRSSILTFNLKSSRIGFKSLSAEIEAIDGEKNTKNNVSEFAIEVIDEQTKVLLISNYTHPDIGAIKKAIESNEQRKLYIKDYNDRGDLNEYDLIIIYGIDKDFPKLSEEIKTLKKNTWLITGTLPDLNVLNRTISEYNIESGREVDNVQPLLNSGFSSFNLDEYSFIDFPPVQAPYGRFDNSIPIEVVMNRKIGSVETTQPLWFTYENEGTRHAVSLLSGLWRWRTQSYLEDRNYKNFDDFIGAHVQYLASNKKRQRLSIDFKSVYKQDDDIEIIATYLDKNYIVDTKGVLNMELVKQGGNEKIVRPFIVNKNNYTVDLNGLSPGDYSFEIKVDNSTIKSSGFFKVLDYDLESMVSNASPLEFQNLLGKEQVYYQGSMDKVVEKLTSDVLLKPIERKINDYFGLIDFQYLLYLLFVLLGLEWFLRKYNGLI